MTLRLSVNQSRYPESQKRGGLGPGAGLELFPVVDSKARLLGAMKPNWVPKWVPLSNSVSSPSLARNLEINRLRQVRFSGACVCWSATNISNRRSQFLEPFARTSSDRCDDEPHAVGNIKQ